MALKAEAVVEQAELHYVHVKKQVSVAQQVRGAAQSL